jgi:hypothetical protein
MVTSYHFLPDGGVDDDFLLRYEEAKLRSPAALLIICVKVLLMSLSLVAVWTEVCLHTGSTSDHFQNSTFASPQVTTHY